MNRSGVEDAVVAAAAAGVSVGATGAVVDVAAAAAGAAEVGAWVGVAAGEHAASIRDRTTIAKAPL